MSEVCTCERCNYQGYASEAGAPTTRTVEYETDDGTILSADHRLCDGCRDAVLYGQPPVCPFCLDVADDEHDPRLCPERPIDDVDASVLYQRVAERLADAGLLTERQALAYVLRDVVERSRAETSDAMGCTVNVVDNHLRAARDKVEGARRTVDELDNLQGAVDEMETLRHAIGDEEGDR